MGNRVQQYNIGITGATGILGRRLLALLVQQGRHRIRCLVRNATDLNIFSSKIEIVQGDLADVPKLAAFVQGLDVCIHLASLVNYATKGQYYATNVLGTKALCDAIVKDNAACRLIHCSSIAVLRRHQFLSFLNTDYTNSKAKADQVVARYCQQKQLQAATIYPGLVYGPGDSNLLPNLAHHLRYGKLLYVSGGEQHCPVIFIDDLCELFRVVMEDEHSSGQAYIGVGPQEQGMHAFIEMLARNINATPPKWKIPKVLAMPVAVAMELAYKYMRKHKFPTVSKRAVDLLSINFPPHLVSEFNKARWVPKVSMATGLPLAVEWCMQQKLIS